MSSKITPKTSFSTIIYFDMQLIIIFDLALEVIIINYYFAVVFPDATEPIIFIICVAAVFKTYPVLSRSCK